MKKNTNLNRVFALLLALCLLLSLTACGDSQSEETTQTESTASADTAAESTPETTTTQDSGEMGYVASYPELDSSIQWYNGATARDGKIYVYDSSYDETSGVFGEYLMVLDSEGNLENTISVGGSDGNSSVNKLVPCDGGYLAYIYKWVEESASCETASEDTDGSWSENTSDASDETEESAAAEDDWTTADTTDDWTQTDTSDVPEGWETATTETETEAETTETETAGSADAEAESETEDATDWVYEEEEVTGYAVYTLVKYSETGEILAEAEITPPEDSDWFYVDSLCVDSEGNVFFNCEYDIYAYDSNLNPMFTVEGSSWITGMTATADGRVLVNYYGDNGRVLAELDTESQSLGEEIAIDGLENIYYFASGLDGQLYGYNDNALYRFDLENGTSEQVIYWLDWDVNGNNISNDSVVVLENGNVMTFGYSSSGDAEACLLTQTPLSEIPQKTELTLGVEYLDYTIREAVLDFNKKNENYRIVIRDYSEYETSDDYMAGYDQLDSDILSGNCPDIICLTNLSKDKYVSKGILADLYTLMSEDTYTKEDFVQNYLNLTEQNGSLYSIASNFMLYTLAGATSYVGEEQGWTMEEFIAAVEKLPEDGLILDYQTRDGFLNTMLYYISDTFIDWDSGTCSFDSAEFTSLLEACMLFPEDTSAYDQYHINNGTEGGYAIDQSYYSMIYNELRDGTMLLVNPDFWSVSELTYGVISCMGDDITWVGFPGAAGNGCVLSPNSEYAISASSQYQDVAWEFLCSYIESSENDNNGFPVLEQSLTDQLAEAMEQQGYTDEDGNFVAYEDVTALTQKQVDMIRSCIDGAECLYHYDEQIISIVTEEAAAYFAGQKTAEEVAEIIQNRVQIYVDEQG